MFFSFVDISTSSSSSSSFRWNFLFLSENYVYAHNRRRRCFRLIFFSFFFIFIIWLSTFQRRCSYFIHFLIINVICCVFIFIFGWFFLILHLVMGHAKTLDDTVCSILTLNKMKIIRFFFCSAIDAYFRSRLFCMNSVFFFFQQTILISAALTVREWERKILFNSLTKHKLTNAFRANKVQAARQAHFTNKEKKKKTRNHSFQMSPMYAITDITKRKSNKKKTAVETIRQQITRIFV